MMYVIGGIVGLIILLGILNSYFFSKTKTSLPSKNHFVYGPYICNGKSLTIDQTFNINNLEGAYSLKDITVTYDNLVFKQAYTFKDVIEKKLGKHSFQAAVYYTKKKIGIMVVLIIYPVHKKV
ncbi:MAG: hypothetical protein WCF92_00495 [bacterium]